MSSRRSDRYAEAVELAARMLAPPEVFYVMDLDRLARSAFEREIKLRAMNVEFRRQLAAWVREGRPIRKPHLREFVAEILEGAAVLPADNGGAPWLPRQFKSGEDVRRYRIRAAVNEIVCRGLLNRTRNDASPPRSACDAVVDGAARHGIHLTFDQVKKLAGRGSSRNR